MTDKKYSRQNKKENKNYLLKQLSRIDKKYYIPIILAIYFILITFYIIFNQNNKNDKSEFADQNRTKTSFIATKNQDKNETKKDHNISITTKNIISNEEKNSTINKSVSIVIDKNSSLEDKNLTVEKNTDKIFSKDQNISEKDENLTVIKVDQPAQSNSKDLKKSHILSEDIQIMDQNLSVKNDVNKTLDNNKTEQEIILDINQTIKDQNLTDASINTDIKSQQNKTEEITIDYKNIKLIDIFPDRYSQLIKEHIKKSDTDDTNSSEDQIAEDYYTQGEVLYIDNEAEEEDEIEEYEEAEKEDIKENVDSSLKVTIQTTNSEISINDLEKKFKNTNSDDIAILIAQRYYSLKDYKNSQKWALIANEINGDNQDSWEIFAKSKYHLGQKQDALKTLKFYNEQAKSQDIDMLIEDIEGDFVKN